MRDMSYLDTPLGPHIADFIRWKSVSNSSPITLDGYERILSRLALTLPPTVTLDALDVHDLVLVLETITKKSKGQHRKVWNVFLKWAIDDERRPSKNPMTRLPKHVPNKRVHTSVFDGSERDALIAAAEYMDDPVRDRLRALLVLGSGCRKGELRGVQVCDVRERDGVVIVTGKGDKTREVPMYGEFWNAWEEAKHAPIPRLDRGWREDDYVWFSMRILGPYRERVRQVVASYPERPMVQRGMHEWWTRLVSHSGIDYRRLHTTRHTFATAALDASHGDLYGVAELLGHASVKTTELYLHSSKRRREEVATALAAMWRDEA